MQACLPLCQHGSGLSAEITAKSSALPSDQTSFRLVPDLWGTRRSGRPDSATDFTCP